MHRKKGEHFAGSASFPNDTVTFKSFYIYISLSVEFAFLKLNACIAPFNLLSLSKLMFQNDESGSYLVSHREKSFFEGFRDDA